MRFTQSEAEGFTKPYAPQLVDGVSTGWRTFQEMPIRYRLALDTTSRANCVHDYIELRIRELFEDIPEARCFECKRLFLLSLKGRVLVRFKKLDDDWMSSGISTQQCLRFLHQMPLPGIAGDVEQLTLFNLPEPAHWEAGYRVSDTGALVGIYLTQPNGTDEPDWVIDLDHLSGGGPGIRHVDVPKSPAMPGVAVVVPKTPGRREGGSSV